MTTEKERLGIKLSRDSVLGLRELKSLLYGSVELPLSDSFIIAEAYKEISDKCKLINWLKLNDKKVKIPGVFDNNDSSISSIRTTLALDRNVYEGMQQIQQDMINETNGRVFFSFVVKLVLFAAILSKKDALEEYLK